MCSVGYVSYTVIVHIRNGFGGAVCMAEDEENSHGSNDIEPDNHYSQIYQDYIGEVEDNSTTVVFVGEYRKNLVRQAFPYVIIVILLGVIFLSAPLAVTGAGKLGLINTKSLDGDDIPEEEVIDEPDTVEEETPVSSVAIGDSTMALSDGEISDWQNGCRHEKGNWPDMLGVEENISCAGADVSKVQRIAKETNTIGAVTEQVYITVGSNSFRDKQNEQDITEQTSELVEIINEKAPVANITFVGYLPSLDSTFCLKGKESKKAKELGRFHTSADKVMNSIAEETNSEFISMDNLYKFDMCNEDNTYIRLPNTTPGAAWHTTSLGHTKIVENIEEYRESKESETE